MAEIKNVYKVYDVIADWFSDNRPTALKEQKYLDLLISALPEKGTVLDLGCGTGRPMMQYLIRQDIQVSGVDASKEMLRLAKLFFPDIEFLLEDMRNLVLPRSFDAIIAWNSFFHLPADDQPAMFATFEKHLNPGGLLLFTSGTERGEAWGINGGENLFHASLDTKEYQTLLEKHQFKILTHVLSDPACYGLTVWLAQYWPASDPVL